MDKSLNGYNLTREWFNWCFENPEKIKPIHTALYLFIVDHCNRMGWKEKFGFPSYHVMESLGIKNWRTYKSALDDLVKFKAIRVISESKNQYTATVVAIVDNTKAPTKALDKAMPKHHTKQVQGTAVIDKLINLETNVTIEEKNPEVKVFHNTSLAEPAKDEANDNVPLQWVKENAPQVLKMKTPLTPKQAIWFSKNYPEDIWQGVFEAMQNRGDLLKKYKDANLTARQWLKGVGRKGWLPYDRMEKASRYEAEETLCPRAMEIYKNKNPLAFTN